MIGTRDPLQQDKANQKSTNFSEVEQRLQTAHAALENIWAPSAEETRRILQTRALTLAQEASSGEDLEDVIEVLEFALAYERYAVETQYVNQVAMLEQLIPLPCTPDFVLGVVNLQAPYCPFLISRISSNYP